VSAMQRKTKHCLVEIQLLTGTRVRGKYHVEASSSSSIRPSDAIRTADPAYILLSDVDVCENGADTHREAILVRSSSIAHLEFLGSGWEGG